MSVSRAWPAALLALTVPAVAHVDAFQFDLGVVALPLGTGDRSTGIEVTNAGVLGEVSTSGQPVTVFWQQQPCPPACAAPAWDLVTLGGPFIGTSQTFLRASNANGTIFAVGYETKAEGDELPLVHRIPRAGTLVFPRYPPPGTFVDGRALDANRAGTIAGFLRDGAGDEHAVVWTFAGNLFDPPIELPGATRVFAISDALAALAHQPDGAVRLYANPVTSQAFDLLADGATDLVITDIGQPENGGSSCMTGAQGDDAILIDAASPDVVLRIETPEPGIAIRADSRGQALVEAGGEIWLASLEIAPESEDYDLGSVRLSELAFGATPAPQLDAAIGGDEAGQWVVERVDEDRTLVALYPKTARGTLEADEDNPCRSAPCEVEAGDTAFFDFIVTSVGALDLGCTAAEIVSNPHGHWAIDSTDIPTTVAPDSSTTVRVRVRTTAIGPTTAQLHVHCPNDPFVPKLSSSLFVQVVPAPPRPAIDVNPDPVAFGTHRTGTTAGLDVTVNSVGTASLVVTDVSFVGDPGPYTLIDGLFPYDTPIPPTLSATFAVELLAGTGDADATLRITSDAHDTPTVDVQLTGRGGVPRAAVEPAGKNFGSLSRGTAAAETFTLSNVGEVDLHVTDLAMAAGSSTAFDFTGPSPGNGFTLVPAASTTFTVRFQPPTAGDHSGEVSISSDDPVESLLTVPVVGVGLALPPGIGAPVGLDFGTVAAGDTVGVDLVVSETGDADLEVTAITVAPPFSVDTTAFTIADGDPARSVRVELTPALAGPIAETLLIDSNDPDAPRVEVVLSAVASGDPDVAVVPASLDFGEVGSAPSVRAVQVHNEAGAHATLLAGLTVDAAGIAAGFRLSASGAPPVTDLALDPIAPGQHATVEVSLTPPVDSGDTFTGTLLLSSNDPDEAVVEVPLRAVLAAPDAAPAIRVGARSVRFDVGGRAEESVSRLRVTNTGDADLVFTLTIGDVERSGEPSPGRFTSEDGNGPFTVPPGAGHTLVLVKSPEVRHRAQADLRIDSNAVNEPTVVVQLVGHNPGAPGCASAGGGDPRWWVIGLALVALRRRRAGANGPGA